MLKKIIVLLFLAVFTLQAGAQDDWKKYTIDPYVSAAFPGEVVTQDTVLHETRIQQYFSRTGTGTIAVQKVKLTQGEFAVFSLPHDAQSLEELYKKVAGGFFEKAAASGITGAGGAIVTVDKHKGYSIKLNYQGRPSGENCFIILGEYLYSFCYVDVTDGFDKNMSATVLKSVAISPDSPPQFTAKNAAGFGKILAIGIVAGAAVLIVVLVIRKRKRQ
jgi:hypothetical protein